MLNSQNPNLLRALHYTVAPGQLAVQSWLIAQAGSHIDKEINMHRAVAYKLDNVIGRLHFLGGRARLAVQAHTHLHLILL